MRRHRIGYLIEHNLKWVISVFIVALLFVLTFTVMFVYEKTVESNVARTEEAAMRNAEKIQYQLDADFDNMRAISSGVKNNHFSSTEKLLKDFKSAEKYLEYADYLMLFDDQGVEFRSNGKIKINIKIKNYLAKKKTCFVVRYDVIDSNVSDSNNYFLMGIPTDITIGGSHFSWLLAKCNNERIQERIDLDTFKGKARSSLVNDNGDFMIKFEDSYGHGEINNFYEALKYATFGNETTFEKFTKMVVSNKMESVIYNQNGENSILVIVPIKHYDWKFLLTVPNSSFNEETRDIFRSIYALLVITGLIAIIIVVLLIRYRKQQNEINLARSANNARMEFLFNMSHDIRTPMNAILGFTDIALKSLDNKEKVTECLTKTKQSSSLLLSLINGILDMSRIETDNMELDEKPYFVRQVFWPFESSMRILATQKNIDISFEFINIIDEKIWVDPNPFNRLLVNLVSNAIKYTPSGGKVEVACEQIKKAGQNGIGEYKFTVKDNGFGMSEEFVTRAFERFAREQNSTISGIQGTGLGLPMCKRLTELMGGEIFCESVQFEGSTFTAILPFKSAENEECVNLNPNTTIEDLYPEDEDKPLLLEKKILLVEDNELNREIAVELLEEAGLKVEEATDGLEAVEAVKKNGTDYYDFILMDIQMPIMNGYEATKEIRNLPEGDKITIIALSANAFKEDIEKSLSFGMTAHIAKPIDTQVLFNTLYDITKKKFKDMEV